MGFSCCVFWKSLVINQNDKDTEHCALSLPPPLIRDLGRRGKPILLPRPLCLLFFVRSWWINNRVGAVAPANSTVILEIV
jgi:hypothetical protein